MHWARSSRPALGIEDEHEGPNIRRIHIVATAEVAAHFLKITTETAQEQADLGASEASCWPLLRAITHLRRVASLWSTSPIRVAPWILCLSNYMFI